LSADFEVIELGQEFGPEIPHMPAHRPFEYELLKQHDHTAEPPTNAPGTSGSSDRIATGLHVGTHIDSLSHVALEGRLCDGTDVYADGVQSSATGVKMRSGPGLRPIIAPGILLDFPRFLGCRVLEDGHEITVEQVLGCAEAAGVEIEPGSVVLFRTGFDLLWDEDPARFIKPSVFPGPEIEVARLLRERGIVATGSDTSPFERYPVGKTLGVHAELLVEGGIFIMECLRLCELAERGVARFQFIALPLRLPTATGSPISPVAVVTAAGSP